MEVGKQGDFQSSFTVQDVDIRSYFSKKNFLEFRAAWVYGQEFFSFVFTFFVQ